MLPRLPACQLGQSCRRRPAHCPTDRGRRVLAVVHKLGCVQCPDEFVAVLEGLQRRETVVELLIVNGQVDRDREIDALLVGHAVTTRSSIASAMVRRKVARSRRTDAARAFSRAPTTYK